MYGTQVIGAYDLYPAYGDRTNEAGNGAWSPLYTFSGFEFLELSFKKV